MNKFCNKCKIEKDINTFHKDLSKKDGVCTVCKECQSAYCKKWNAENRERNKLNNAIWHENNRERQNNNTRKYYNNNKEEISSKNKEKYKNNPSLAKDKDLRKIYNISLEEYNKILASQNNSCAICKKHESEFTKSLAVDHCHKSGKIRGLLCINCNRALGNIKDSVENLRNAIEYLE